MANRIRAEMASGSGKMTESRTWGGVTIFQTSSRTVYVGDFYKMQITASTAPGMIPTVNVQPQPKPSAGNGSTAAASVFVQDARPDSLTAASHKFWKVVLGW